MLHINSRQRRRLCCCHSFFGSLLLLVVTLVAAAATKTATLTPKSSDSNNTTAQGRLLVLFIDGLRWDYPLRSGLPNFKRLRSEGASAEALKPVFPTVCYPNIISFFTGLHPESHGIVNNYMFDSGREFTFHSHNLTDWLSPHAVPLWHASQAMGLPASVYHLPGCHNVAAAPHHSTSTCADNFRVNLTMNDFEDAVYRSLEALRLGSIHLAVVYSDVLDKVGHQHGPESRHLNVELSRVDALLGRLLRFIDQYDPSLHLIVAADHGMAKVSKRRVVDLKQLVRFGDLDHVRDYGGMVALWPKGEDELKIVHQQLVLGGVGKLKIYKRAELPAAWQLRNHPRMPPILAMAHAGYFIESFGQPYPNVDGKPVAGWHGYDPAESSMWSTLLVRGPSIRPGHSFGRLSVLDVYPLMCGILGLPSQPNNATQTHLHLAFKAHLELDSQLVDEVTRANLDFFTTTRFFVILICIILCMFFNIFILSVALLRYCGITSTLSLSRVKLRVDSVGVPESRPFCSASPIDTADAHDQFVSKC